MSEVILNEIKILFNKKTTFFIIAAFCIICGVYSGMNLRGFPDLIDEIGAVVGTLPLYLIITNDSIFRDKNQGISDIIYSTQLKTWKYVGGKYLASVLFSIFLLGFYVISTILTNQLYTGKMPSFLWGYVIYPAVNPLGILYVWALETFIPLIFGLALFDFLAVLSRFNRTVPIVALISLWLIVQHFIAQGLLYYLIISAGSEEYFFDTSNLINHIFQRAPASVVMPLAQQTVFQPIPIDYVINRLVVLLIGMVCIGLTIGIVHRQRSNLQ